MNGKGEEKGTGYLSGSVRGRPRFWSVDERPSVAAVVACQSFVPKSCCRLTYRRSIMRAWANSTRCTSQSTKIACPLLLLLPPRHSLLTDRPDRFEKVNYPRSFSTLR
jgi:hypothetical protein